MTHSQEIKNNLQDGQQSTEREKITDEQREAFCIKLAGEADNHCNSYSAHKTPNGHWKFGYVNDYPLQHGKGKEWFLHADLIDILVRLANRP